MSVEWAVSICRLRTRFSVSIIGTGLIWNMTHCCVAECASTEGSLSLLCICKALDLSDLSTTRYRTAVCHDRCAPKFCIAWSEYITQCSIFESPKVFLNAHHILISMSWPDRWFVRYRIWIETSGPPTLMLCNCPICICDCMLNYGCCCCCHRVPSRSFPFESIDCDQSDQHLAQPPHIQHCSRCCISHTTVEACHDLVRQNSEVSVVCVTNYFGHSNTLLTLFTWQDTFKFTCIFSFKYYWCQTLRAAPCCALRFSSCVSQALGTSMEYLPYLLTLQVSFSQQTWAWLCILCYSL